MAEPNTISHLKNASSTFRKNNLMQGENPLTSKKVCSLASQIFPLTRPYHTKEGKTIQLWGAPNLKLVGSIKHKDGAIRVVSSMSIQNPLAPNESPSDLYMRLLLSSEDCEWTFAEGRNGSLTIWPKLKAAGWQDAIPRPNGDCSRLNQIFRGRSQAEACEWFFSNGFKPVFVSKNAPRIQYFHPSDPNIKTPLKGAPINDPGIPNQLRAGNRLDIILPDPKGKENDPDHSGSGVVFQHPKDSKRTTFNLDFSMEKNSKGAIPAGIAADAPDAVVQWEQSRQGGASTGDEQRADWRCGAQCGDD